MSKPKPSGIPGKYSEKDVNVGGVSLHVGIWAAKGPTVLCVHGLTANHLSFMAIAATLQAAGFNVLAPDLRGRGLSDKPQGEYSLETHCQDMFGLLRALKVEKTAIVGHSLGAAIAVRMAAGVQSMVNGLALMDGGGLLSFPKKLKILGVVKPSLARLGRVFPDSEAYVRLLSGGSLFDPSDPLVRAHIAYELEEVPGGVMCNIPRHVIESEVTSQGGSLDTGVMLRRFLRHPLRQLALIRAAGQIPYESISVPVLVMKAGKANLKEGDDLLPLEALRMMERRIPNAQSQIFSDMNHYDMVLRASPARDKSLIDFLRSLPR